MIKDLRWRFIPLMAEVISHLTDFRLPALNAEWRPGSTGQILSDLDLTSQKEGRWKRINTLAHYNVSNDGSFP